MSQNDLHAGLTQLGSVMSLPAGPEDAILERVENPQKGVTHVVCFTAPELASLCPMTGQPHFAHPVIDYVRGDWLV